MLLVVPLGEVLKSKTQPLKDLPEAQRIQGADSLQR